MLGCLDEIERNTVLIISKDKKTNVYVFFIIQTSVYTIKLLKEGIFLPFKTEPPYPNAVRITTGNLRWEPRLRTSIDPTIRSNTTTIEKRHGK